MVNEVPTAEYSIFIWADFITYSTANASKASGTDLLLGPRAKLLIDSYLDTILKDFRELLERAKQYDIDNNQPDCELEEKKKKLLDLAEELGVRVDFL